MIGYDINKEGAVYRAANKALTDKIKAEFEPWWHHLDSTWFVVSDRSAVDIRDILQTCLDSNDELLVLKSGHEAAWTGFNKKGPDWLQTHL